MNRRKLLQTTGAALASGLLPRVPMPTWTKDEQYVLDLARRLRGNEAKRLRLLIPEGSGPNITPLVAAFEQGCGVKIVVQEAPVDDVATFILLNSTKSDPGFDMALPPTFALADLVESESILNLDELVSEYAPPGPESAALTPLQGRYKGRFYGYATDGDAYLLFFNKRILERLPEESPERARYLAAIRSPMTWDELDSMMESCFDPEKPVYGGTLYRNPGYVTWEWWMRLHAQMRYPFDEDMHPQIDGPEGVAALEALIRASAWQTPRSSTNGLFANWQDFAKGQSLCNLGWGGTQKYLQLPESRVRDHLQISLTPGFRHEGQVVPISYYNWGWNFVLSRTTQVSELAYLFSRYATLPGPSTLAVSARDGFFDPFLVEHFDEPVLQGVYSKQFLEEQLRSLRSSIPDFCIQGRGEYFEVLGRFLRMADERVVTPQEALRAVAKSWEKITERVGRESQSRQWRFLRSLYPENLRGLLRG